MLTKHLLPVIAILLLAVVINGCNKDIRSKTTTGTVTNKSTKNATASISSMAVTPQPGFVDLKSAGNFTLLSKTGITDVYPSIINGSVGTSPITGAALLLSCTEVTKQIYTVDAAGPLPCSITNPSGLTTAVGDMQTAYTDAANRKNPNNVDLAAGNIGGLNFGPGLYKWNTPVIIPADITLTGSSTDIWIFQISGTLIMSSAVNITLIGGANPNNIYWQVADAVTLGTTSHFQGIILGQTSISVKTHAIITGKLFAQTAITLQMNTIGPN